VVRNFEFFRRCENMGFNKENVSLKLQGMQIMEVGTLDKKDITLLKKIAAERKGKKFLFKK
jgi:hypothetical protein